MTRVALRVGLIGSVAALFTAFLSLIPLLGNCLFWLFSVLLWISLGVLVAHWRPPLSDDREVTWGAGIAGAITGLTGGLSTVLLAPVGLLLLGGTEGTVRLLPSELIQAYQTAGLDPYVLFSPPGVFLIAFVTCGLQFFIAPLTSALAAVISLHLWGIGESDLWEEDTGPYMLEW